MWQRRRKTVLMVAAGLYVLFGILAFFDIPGGHDEHHHTFAHNLTHIVLGLVLFGVAMGARPGVRQHLCLAFALGYFLLSMVGAWFGGHATLVVLPGVIEFHAGDYAVHFATGLFFAALSVLRRSDQRATPAGGT